MEGEDVCEVFGCVPKMSVTPKKDDILKEDDTSKGDDISKRDDTSRDAPSYTSTIMKPVPSIVRLGNYNVFTHDDPMYDMCSINKCKYKPKLTKYVYNLTRVNDAKGTLTVCHWTTRRDLDILDTYGPDHIITNLIVKPDSNIPNAVLSRLSQWMTVSDTLREVTIDMVNDTSTFKDLIPSI